MKSIKQIIKETCPGLVSLKKKARQGMDRAIQERRRVALERRRATLLRGVSKDQLGLEFGPSHSPIAPKKMGYHVETVDWLDREGLVKQFGAHGVDVDAIEEVDYVGSGNYYELIHKDAYYDYMIASHMIEHTPNMAQFLQDCSRMLKIGGILILAIPDKRYEYDMLRAPTDISRVLDDYFSNAGTHSPGLRMEHLSSVVKRNGDICWSKSLLPWNRLKGIKFFYDQAFVNQRMTSILEDSAYEDIHHYVFTPNSFKLLMYDLRQMGLVDLEIAEMRASRTYTYEFIAILRRTDEPPIPDVHYRMKLMKKRDR